MQYQVQLMQQMMHTQAATMGPGMPHPGLGYNPMFPSVLPPGMGLLPAPGTLPNAPVAGPPPETGDPQHRAPKAEDRTIDKMEDDKDRKERKDRDRDRDKESKKDPKDRR